MRAWARSGFTQEEEEMQVGQTTNLTAGAEETRQEGVRKQVKGGQRQKGVK